MQIFFVLFATVLVTGLKTKFLTCAKSLFFSAFGEAFLSWEEPPDVFNCHSNVVNLQDVTTPTADKPEPIIKKI